MNLFSPPTDSIYKFCGIAGLVLFGYIAFYLFTPDQNHKKLAMLEEEINLVNTKFFILRDEMIVYDEGSDDSVRHRQIFDFQLADVGSSKFKEIIYSFPLLFQSKYQNLYIQDRQLNYKISQLKKRIADQNFIDAFIIAFFYIGELACVWGLLIWYLDTKDEKRLRVQEKLSVILLSHVCQSCYKQFIFNSERGTNRDGTMSNCFCEDCYINGSYTELELTLDEAKNRLQSRLEKLQYKPARIKRGLKGLESLDRWRRQKIW